MTQSRRKLEKAQREAAAWHTRLKATRAQDRSLDTLVPRWRAWLAAAPQNRAAFERQQHLCRIVALAQDPLHCGRGDGVDASERAPRFVPAWVASHPAISVVAIAVVLLALGGAFYERQDIACALDSAGFYVRCDAALEKRASPPGEPIRWDLADGTRVLLNGALTVDIDLRKPRRRVRLEQGEASFDVRRANIPFEVSVGPVLVQTLGTAFRIKKTSAEGSETVVLEGTIEISAPQRQHRFVTAGEVADFDGEHVRVHALEPLKLRGVPLDEAVRMINFYNLHTALVVDPSIAHQRIGGQFNATDPGGFAAGIERLFGIEHSVSRDPVRGTEIIRFSGRKTLPGPLRGAGAVNKGSS